MELLGAKGADILTRVRNSASGEGVDQGAPSNGLSKIPRIWKLVAAAAVVVILVGLCLLFSELAVMGLTWDEGMDYGIALDYYKNHAFLTNRDDPSQARFSHIVASVSFMLLGDSYLSFKLPFALIGLFGGIALFAFLRREVDSFVAVVITALYFTCPYVLAASRTGATAGDVLSLVTTLGFVITAHHWLRKGRFWPHGAACGLACGLAIGSKWTGALLLVATALLWAVSLLRRRRLFIGSIWTALLAHQWIAVALAVLASPTLMLGLPFVQGALNHSLDFTGMALLQFGEVRATAPWYYVPAVLVSKLSPLQLAAACYVLLAALFARLFKKRRASMLIWICLLSLLPIVPLATKGFQNAHYYVGFVPCVMILSAVALDGWLKSTRKWIRGVGLGFCVVAMGSQLWLSAELFPDFLLAGRQFGPSFNGQFPGPAVNHCQGMPLAIREVNEAIERGDGPKAAYLLHSCLGILNHAQQHGPVRPIASIGPYPDPAPSAPHLVIVPGSHDYDCLGEPGLLACRANKAKVTGGCELVEQPYADFELWSCPAR